MNKAKIKRDSIMTTVNPMPTKYNRELRFMDAQLDAVIKSIESRCDTPAEVKYGK